MDKYNLTDLVDGLQIGDNDENMLHVCKRKNNAKRDYLFVNKWQGKHVPVDGLRTERAVENLYEKAYPYLADKSNILVVGFAETATAIGEMFFENAVKGGKSGDHVADVTTYVHTTREKLAAKKLEFAEEHSHATEQYLYAEKLPEDCEYLVFVEDEITTGNTILNFIKGFKKIYKNIKHYYVVSFANWQTKECQKNFEDNNVTAIALVTGSLKSNIEKMEVRETALTGYNLDSLKVKLEGCSLYDTKQGISVEEFSKNLEANTKIVNYILQYVDRYDRIDVVGTEEFMYPAIKATAKLTKMGYTATTHSTTRSPIQTAEDCILTNGVKLHSAYEAERDTYLYNLNTKTTKVFILVKGEACREFVSDICTIYGLNGVALSNIHIIEF